MSLDSSGNLLVCNSFGIFKTSNDGLNWLQICNEGSILSIAVSGNNTIYAGNSYGKIIKSTNGGLNWLKIFNNDVYGGNSSVMDLMIKPDGKLFAGYYYLGVFRSLDTGVSWQKFNFGLSNQRVCTVLSDGNGKIFAGTFHDGLYYTTNRGTNWILTGLENKYSLQIGFNGSGNIFVYTPESQGGLYRSTNGGLNWTQFNNGIPQGNINQFLRINSDLYAATDNGIYKTTNNGINWIMKSPNAFRFRYIKENNNHVLFAASDSRLYRSSDLGENWQTLDSLGYYNQGICIHSPNTVYCISSARLYRSTNLGNTWFIADSTANFGNLTCNVLGVLFVSDWDGIYRSMDFGVNWEQINSGLTFTDITSMNFDEQGYLYAGTWGAGVFRSVESTVSVQIINTEIPKSFSLSQNYPNPFNPVTNIKFDIPKSGFVEITIYDLLGREVTKLVNQQMQAGSYNVDWDASNYPSGVYFYELVAGSYADTKKMVLIK